MNGVMKGKGDMVKSVVMNGVMKGKEDMVKSVVMNEWIQVEILENWKIVKMTKKRRVEVKRDCANQSQAVS